MDLLKKRFEEIWEYRLVLEVTPEMERWRRHNERVLIMSRPAQDLTEDVEQDILNGINSPQCDSAKALRLCVVGKCLLG